MVAGNHTSFEGGPTPRNRVHLHFDLIMILELHIFLANRHLSACIRLRFEERLDSLLKGVFMNIIEVHVQALLFVVIDSTHRAVLAEVIFVTTVFHNLVN